MGKKLYQRTSEGGFEFISERRPGEVRIPNYVFDLWLPLLGIEAVGVYATYCRLEMEGCVQKITMQRLAAMFRVGKDKLTRVHEKLEDCDFIHVEKPGGSARLKHFTTKITVKDPPKEVSAALIEKYKTAEDYEPLSTWLVSDDPNPHSERPKSDMGNDQPQEMPETGLPDDPNPQPGRPNSALDNDLEAQPVVESLDLNPLPLQPFGVESSSSVVSFPTTPPPDDDDEPTLRLVETKAGQGQEEEPERETMLLAIFRDWHAMRNGGIPRGPSGDKERANIRADILEYGPETVRHAMAEAEQNAKINQREIWSWNFVRQFLPATVKKNVLDPGVPDDPKDYVSGRLAAFINNTPDAGDEGEIAS